MSSTMTPVLPFPSEPPQRFPVIYYKQALVVDGVSVCAVVTNLTAAFLDELGDDFALVA